MKLEKAAARSCQSSIVSIKLKFEAEYTIPTSKLLLNAKWNICTKHDFYFGIDLPKLREPQVKEFTMKLGYCYLKPSLYQKC